jgi:hypothetical protein
MLKWPFGKAAASEGPRRYKPHFVWAVRPRDGSWRTEKLLSDSDFRELVEDLNDARTLRGKRRVSARRGWVGEKRDFFSILLRKRPHT